ncbi:DUF2577 domain-containing protein [Bacillus sp. FJAT-49736]|uniref:DUF2577 domain-containing protein n=1 Tax=Bacillus sp. FJAT-49736 TaxID=2833582 RepID=UPI001BC94F20|nr:DUF2577 domain-containing protein [Bacillus sp. FJAT-49736]MBS4172129.1 DUF2577 domain-containing protein [Bacillus sp. FJAT-49736]
MSLLHLIKQAGADAVDAQNPVGIMFGIVSKINPLEVFVEQRFTLTEDFLVLTETVTKSGLKDGDKLILIRVQGGQEYIVLDKVGG